MFRIPPPYLWTPLSPQRVKGCSPLTIPKMRSKPKNASRFAKRIFLCFSHLRLRRRFHVSAGRYRQQRGNTSCEAANRRNEKKVQQRRPPPVAETGRSCWGSGQQDASGSEADAGSRNPGSVTEGDGEGKPVSIEYLHSDMHRPLSGLILSLCFLFLDDILALSGASRQLSQRESL